MIRRVLAVLAGAVFAALIVSSTDAAIVGAFPLPPGTDVHEAASVRAAVAALPRAALIILVAGWVIAAAGGSFVAAFLAPSARVRHGVIVTALLLLATVANLVTIPHPVWVWIAALILVPVVGFGAARAAAIARPERG